MGLGLNSNVGVGVDYGRMMGTGEISLAIPISVGGGGGGALARMMCVAENSGLEGDIVAQLCDFNPCLQSLSTLFLIHVGVFLSPLALCYASISSPARFLLLDLCYRAAV
jgi:hypothetical protein